MKVLTYEITPGSWTVLIPSKPTGLYPTPWAAARAAWNVRDHGTPDDLITPVASDKKEIA